MPALPPGLGIADNVFAAPLAVYMARLAVVDDQWREDELHLLRFLPRAWCAPGQPAVFEAVPTEFGPVSLRLDLSAEKSSLDVHFRTDYRHAPERTVLHTPPLPDLKTVRVNGREIDVRQSPTFFLACTSMPQVVLFPQIGGGS